MGERVYLIDGSALVYRSHFAFIRNPLVTSSGENVSAVYGFAQTLFMLLREEAARYAAVVFDTPAPTERHERYVAYKAHRPAMPEISVAQRVGNFREVELGYDEHTAQEEAKRCLRCDLEWLDWMGIARPQVNQEKGASV